MNHFIKTTRPQRVASIVVVGLLFLFLQASEGVRVASSPLAHASSTFWVLYMCYALIALLFYGIGSLCWLYAYSRQHRVTMLLFGFTSLMMVAFSSLSASEVGDGTFSVLGSISCILAVLILFFLFLEFPYRITSTLGRTPRMLLSTFTTLVCVLAILTCLWEVGVSLLRYAAPSWWILIGFSYYLLASSAIVGLVIFSARRASTVREQQQSRLFFLGTLLSFVPILGLTVIPMILHSPFVVDGGLSMIFLILFPLSMGYAVLRYNLLIFDAYVKKVVTTLINAIGLALLAFVLFSIGSALATSKISLPLAGLLLAGVLGAPCIWWVGNRLTERVFFPEARYYQRILKQAQRLHQEQSFDLQQVCHLLAIDIMTTLNAPGVCAFVFDEETHMYSLVPSPLQEEKAQPTRAVILDQISEGCSFSPTGSPQIEKASALMQYLDTSGRPLFWDEVRLASQEASAGQRWPKPYSSLREGSLGALFAPLRSPQGQVIGIVAIGERGDEQRYAGPELEALTHLLHQTALAVETARQFQITVRQQERTAHEREEAYQQQRQLSEMKDQLIIHMGHELRTPLSEVSGYLELMKEFGETLETEMRTLFIGKALHGCDELLELLTTILDAAEAKVLTPPQRETLPLAALLAEEIAHLDPIQAQHHRLVLRVENPLSCWANEQWLRQVVRNLLSNALKYAPANTTIMVSATAEAGETVLCVKDEGPGITPAEIPLLFGKFVRLARHHSGSIRGTGLGLYISRQLVEAMSGHIWAESSGHEGEGTAFFVRLPQSTPTIALDESIRPNEPVLMS